LELAFNIFLASLGPLQTSSICGHLNDYSLRLFYLVWVR